MSDIFPVDQPETRGAILGYDNKLVGASTTDAAKALEKNTWNRWKPSGTFTEKFQLSSADLVSYIAIGAHNLKGETIILGTATTVGGAVTELTSINVTDNSPIMFLIDNPTSVAEVIIKGTLSAQKEIGVVYGGIILQMPIPIYGGHTPINLGQQTNFETVISESGQFIGRTIKRKGLQTSFEWQYINPNWYRDTFLNFVELAKTTPFFIKWRPDLFPNENAFGFTTGDIEVSNAGGGSQLLTVSMSMRAHSDL